jgi:hypothetical protein
VITGFNTDIEHDGVVYHVQTEDKGLDTPFILSLVYVGGAILASKRAPYEDLIAEGFSDEVLSERLKRQHRLICAAINSGRINDLKKMSGRPGATGVTAPLHPIEGLEEPESSEDGAAEGVEAPAESEPPVETSAQDDVLEIVDFSAPIDEPTFDEDQELLEQEERSANLTENDVFEIADIPSQTWVPPTKPEPPPPDEDPELVPVVIEPPHDEAYSVHDPRGHSASGEPVPDDGLTILLLDDSEFNAGESRTMRVMVVDRRGGDEKPLNSVAVSIKILGTAFRPQIYSLKTNREGVATVATQIPQFNSGRAAVLVRAVVKDQAAELRKVIHPGK